MQIYAFIGPSGTGKSHRAQMVANRYNIDYIIDDALLINNSKVIAGLSAKTKNTKIASVKSALFLDEERQKEMKRALKENNVEKLLILGTSDDMIDRIIENLALPKVDQKIYIQDVATKEEMEQARNIRLNEGKHVVPVPTLEVKEQFSGYFIDAFKTLFVKDKEQVEVSEKSIIRPTFSYLGKYVISEVALKSMIAYISLKVEEISRVNRIQIEKIDSGINVVIDVTIIYGHRIPVVVNKMIILVKQEMEKYTGITMINLKVNVKDIDIKK